MYTNSVGSNELRATILNFCAAVSGGMSFVRTVRKFGRVQNRRSLDVPVLCSWAVSLCCFLSCPADVFDGMAVFELPLEPAGCCCVSCAKQTHASAIAARTKRNAFTT